MSLFSKLFNRAEKAAADMFGEEKKYFTDTASKEADRYDEPVRQAAQAPQTGLSWGPVMPAEENQFSYNGSYVDYFSHVFAADFPEYTVTASPAPRTRGTLFTFTQGGRIALQVEVLSEASNATRFRRECQLLGTPYLRFYYDHDGWWNTRSYVSGRVRSALN